MDWILDLVVFNPNGTIQPKNYVPLLVYLVWLITCTDMELLGIQLVLLYLLDWLNKSWLVLDCEILVLRAANEPSQASHCLSSACRKKSLARARARFELQNLGSSSAQSGSHVRECWREFAYRGFSPHQVFNIWCGSEYIDVEDFVEELFICLYLCLSHIEKPKTHQAFILS